MGAHLFLLFRRLLISPTPKFLGHGKDGPLFRDRSLRWLGATRARVIPCFCSRSLSSFRVVLFFLFWRENESTQWTEQKIKLLPAPNESPQVYFFGGEVYRVVVRGRVAPQTSGVRSEEGRTHPLPHLVSETNCDLEPMSHARASSSTRPTIQLRQDKNGVPAIFGGPATSFQQVFKLKSNVTHL